MLYPTSQPNSYRIASWSFFGQGDGDGVWGGGLGQSLNKGKEGSEKIFGRVSTDLVNRIVGGLGQERRQWMRREGKRERKKSWEEVEVGFNQNNNRC